nr:phosphotransferase [Legionella jordanis]
MGDFLTADIEEIVLNHYCLKVSVTKLPGGHDVNFHLTGDDKRQFLFKISHPDEPKLTLEMQNAALLHLNSNRYFKVPEPQKTTSGDFILLLNSDNAEYRYARLFTYIEDQLLAEELGESLDLLSDFGEKLGQLSLALDKFQHASAKRTFSWDLLQANLIGGHLSKIGNETDKTLIENVYNHFIDAVQPKLAKLRSSIIHNDANPWNVLVSRSSGLPRISGFIDFGDMIESATICELAIAVTHAVMGKKDPLQAAAAIIEHYHAIYPLQEDEVEVLFDLMLIRLCVTVVHSLVRNHDGHDTNDTLSMVEEPSWKLLRKLSQIDASDATRMFKEACQMEEYRNHFSF